ncbi:MAG TPA: ACP phosphodiesterase [Puia sp.]|nr:ACP phosphodiesterase [Puia sp.]
MNYLAHAYLSFSIPEIAVGNLISDFVKGKKKLDYPETIQKGISLHRAIDAFTDAHEITRQAKVFFRADYGLYAGALTDVVYDHFLANDPHEFAGGANSLGGGSGLSTFAEKTYEQLAPFLPLFPEQFARMFPYMRSQNWLYNYRYKEGIFSSFTGLSRRAAYMGDPGKACELFETHYKELEACYALFFPALKDFAFATLEQLMDPGEGFKPAGTD